MEIMVEMDLSHGDLILEYKGRMVLLEWISSREMLLHILSMEILLSILLTGKAV